MSVVAQHVGAFGAFLLTLEKKATRPGSMSAEHFKTLLTPRYDFLPNEACNNKHAEFEKQS